MPSTVGHALAGVAAAWTADLVPGDRGRRTAPPIRPFYDRAGGRLTLACAGLAAIPDIDLLFGVHRTVTHSIGAVILVIIVAALVTGKVTRRSATRVVLMCGGAYATHLVLDWMAADSVLPYGIQALWPFTDAWYISGWNLFRQVTRRHFLSTAAVRANALAVAQEIAILGPVLVALWLVRVKALARLAPEVARRDHPAQ